MTIKELQTEYEQLMNSPVFKEDERVAGVELAKSLTEMVELQRLINATIDCQLDRILKQKGWL